MHELENRPCKRIQPQRTIYFKILFIQNVQNNQIYRDEKSVRVYLGGCLPGERDRRGWGVTPKEKEFLSRIMKMFQNWLWWWMHNSVNSKSHFIVHFKWVNCMVLTMVCHDHLFLLNPIMSGFQPSFLPFLLPLLQPCWPPCVSWIYQTHSLLRDFALTLLW